MIKKFTTFILIFVILFSCSTVLAEPAEKEEKEKVNTEEKVKEKPLADSPHVILLDMNTGSVLYKKEGNTKCFSGRAYKYYDSTSRS